MIVKAQDLYEAFPSIQKIANLDLPIKKSYKLAKFLKKVTSEMTTLETKRAEIFKKHNITKNADLANATSMFNDEIKEFNDIEVTIDHDKLDQSDLENPEKEVELSARDLMVLEPFIKFKDE